MGCGPPPVPYGRGMPPSIPFARLLEARSARALDVRADGVVLVASDLTGSFQLYRTDLEGAPLRRLTDLTEPVSTARFIPGSADIVLAVDRGGDELYQLHLVDDGGGPLRDLVVEPGCRHVLGSVRPDGGAVAYVSNRRNGVDFDVWVRRLDTGEESCVLEGGHNDAGPFSPDGRWLPVVRLGGLAMNTDILLCDLVHGGHRVVTPHEGAAASFGTAWHGVGAEATLLFTTDIGRDQAGIARYQPDGDGWEYLYEPGWSCLASPDPEGTGPVLVAVNDDGRTRLDLLDPRARGRMGTVPLPAVGIAFDQMATPMPHQLGDTTVYTFTSTAAPSDVYAARRGEGEPRRLTHSPAAIPPTLARDPELVRVRSFDGLEVPLFLYRPREDGGRSAPVVLFIHGGPEGQFVPTFNSVILHLVDAGFAVVAPNVRGSTGYGREYVHLDDVRLRPDSVRDLAAIHAWLPSAGLDADRAALLGGSYGGYMVLAGLAFQPELWAAGVSIVGISSLVTFLENTSPYRRHVREVEYGSLEHDRDFLHEVSPLTHVERMRAPLMLVHGANDPRVPLSETEQMHRTLRERGVETELLVYPDEGHGLQKLHNRLDAYPRVAAFLERHLGLTSDLGRN